MLVEQEKLNSSATVTVEVVDINDNNPVFIRDSFTAELQETAIPGTSKASTLYRKSDLFVPRNETTRPPSQFLHSWICERFIYS
jgi:hypothetical protein